MRRKLTRLTAVACVAAPVAILLWLSADRDVTIAPAALDFGDVEAAEPKSQTLLISNPTSRSLTVHVVADCDCVSLQRQSLQVPARSQSSLNVGLRKIQGDHRQGLHTFLESELRVAVVDGSAGADQGPVEFVVPVHARFYEPYMVDRQASVVRGSAQDIQQWVIPLAAATDDIAPPQVEGLPSFVESVDIQWNERFNSGELHLTLKPETLPGKHESSLVLETASHSGEPHAPMQLPLQAHIFPPYQFSHSALMLGGLMEIERETIQLHATSAANCTIEAIDCASEHIRLDQIDETSFSVQLDSATELGPGEQLTAMVDVSIACQQGQQTFEHQESLPVHISVAQGDRLQQ